MFCFKPSIELLKKMFENLASFGVVIPPHDDKDLKNVQVQFAKAFGGVIGMYAQRTRYGFPKEGLLEFAIVADGKFIEEMEEDIGGSFGVPPGEKGDELLREIATEFLVWVQEGDHATNFHPRAPLTKFVVIGNNVTGHVRPRDPPLHDPNFVRATNVERD